MKTLILLLLAGAGIVTVLNDPERSFFSSGAGSAQTQSAANQLHSFGRQLLQAVPANDVRIVAAAAQDVPVDRAVSPLPLASEDVPSAPRLRVIGGNSSPTSYIAAKPVSDRCEGAIRFDLNGRVFCDL